MQEKKLVVNKRRLLKQKKSWTFLLILSAIAVSLAYNRLPAEQHQDKDDFYRGFVDPPAEARPFVRWWWNGNEVTSVEIRRELGIMKAAGIGGIEINPIAMPGEAKNTGARPVKWLSREWNLLVAEASAESKKRGMITDMIVGSGWPFGGEFLKEHEMIQRVISNQLSYSGREEINLSIKQLIDKAIDNTDKGAEGHAISNELLFVKLMPVTLKSVREIIDLTAQIKKGGKLLYKIPDGKHELVYGIRQRGHRSVMHGAWGSKGPVMDHFSKTVTQTYLERLKAISRDSGVPLSQLFRALFCDSIELAGANWTDGFAELFFQTYGYRLEPYYAFVFYNPKEGYEKLPFEGNLADVVKRVRYDYNRLLVKTFLNNFTRTFQQFCTDNGVLCRYQAYGTPFLMGMMEGNMIPDIPESNNWIKPSEIESDRWVWSQEHGYMIWNLYAASGGHLSNRKVISVESMTNTSGVFKTSLEEIKRADDMNFITGMNHSVLHGYNYSPPEAGFPGWVRYGTYFSEQNTWWPYFPKWVDYNARLSYVFQESQPVKDIAILGPTGDLWSNTGLSRVPFHITPWYCYRLWETLSQNGSSADYISEAIIQQATKAKGKLNYGRMSYQAVVLCNVESLAPETATALETFAREGGKLIIVGTTPHRSLSLGNAAANDKKVVAAFEHIRKYATDRVWNLSAPKSKDVLFSWTQQMLNSIAIEKDVEIEKPDANVFQIRKKKDDKDIFFFVNSNRVDGATIKANFPTANKTAWIWDPETGDRKIYAGGKAGGNLTIELRPLQSLLLVFEPDNITGEKFALIEGPGNLSETVTSGWTLMFSHVNGKKFERQFDRLASFGTGTDSLLNNFAGTIHYKTNFFSDGKGKWMNLGKVNKGITEVRLNGNKIGVNWYGEPLYNIGNNLKKGNNVLEIKYTSVLANYCKSLRDNPTAKVWTEKYSSIPIGLEGPVQILK